jgi:N utilization substance protein B
MKYPAHARARARRYAMQALYQWDLSGTDLPAIRRQFLETEDFSKADRPYFEELLRNIPGEIDLIDKNIEVYLDRSPDRVDPVERAILRIATYELLSRTDIPYRIILNEAILMARKFGAEQGHAFVNGILDKVAHKLRAAECRQVGRQVAGH